MWIQLVNGSKDNPLFAQACRRLRRGWWRSWAAPALAFFFALVALLILVRLNMGAKISKAGLEGFTPTVVLRLILVFLAPLTTLFAYVAGAKSVQREREKGTLETLLLTDLTNIDLLSGKVLSSLLPFVIACLGLAPVVVVFGTTEAPPIPTLFTKSWRLQEMVEGFWYLPHWELLANMFLGAVLGVVYGIHRAAHFRRPTMIFTFGMITFLLFVPIVLQVVSHLFQALIEIPVRFLIMFHSGKLVDFTPYQPYARVLGGLGATWLMSLIPLFELADQFRYLCEEEQDPRYLRIRKRPGSGTKPVPWTERKQRMPVEDLWEEWEKRRQTSGKQPRTAILPRTHRSRSRDSRR